MSADHVPAELIEDIFSRLPVKSLVRFKTVSKKWYSLVSQDYKFAKFHLKQSKTMTKTKNHYPVFLQITPGVFQSYDINNTNASPKKFNCPVEDEVVLIGSANGLVCVALLLNKGCYIWNPCTREYKKICAPMRDGVRVFGFGYDSCSDNYKIVANWAKHFRVFSLKKNSWNKFEWSSPLVYYVDHKAFNLNGALHWCHNEKIIAFDLAKEVIYYIQLPDELKVTSHRHFELVRFWEFQGLLCLSDATRSLSIWVMKIYGDPKSWVKFSTSMVWYKRPLAISTVGEVVYLEKGGGFELVKSDIQGMMSSCPKLHIYDFFQT